MSFDPVSTLPSSPLLVGNPTYLKKWHAALARVKAGTGNAKILCIGDSTTHGPTVNRNTDPYPAVLNGLINSYVASSNYYYTAPSSTTTDTRLAITGGWGLNGFGVGGGAWVSSAAGTLAFTPAFQTDTLEVIYMGNSGRGSVAVNVNGGATLATINTSTGSLGVFSQTITTTLGANVWNLVGNATGANIAGWRAWNSANQSVFVANYGRNGATTESAVGLGGWTGLGGWQQLDGITNFAPNLAIVSLGVNDTILPMATATHLGNLATIIATVRAAGGDVLLCNMVPSDPAANGGLTGNRIVNEALYSAAYPAFAASQGVAFLDCPYTRWGGSAGAIANGLMFDGLHPNAVGMSDWARAIYTVLANV